MKFNLKSKRVRRLEKYIGEIQDDNHELMVEVYHLVHPELDPEKTAHILMNHKLVDGLEDEIYRGSGTDGNLKGIFNHDNT